MRAFPKSLQKSNKQVLAVQYRHGLQINIHHQILQPRFNKCVKHDTVRNDWYFPSTKKTISSDLEPKNLQSM
jgi:hypothetical protein